MADRQSAMLDQAVFLFLVASIKQQLGGNVYANPLLCFCAALGITPDIGQGVFAACLTAAATEVKRPDERLVVIGQGGLFTGRQLSPAIEKLLLNTCNWLLGREDRLPKADAPEWSYPRVELDEKRKFLWHWGTFLGLPAFFAWLGLIVLMIRKVR